MATRYVTLAELTDQIPDNLQGLLTDDTADGLTRDDDIATAALEYAEQTVESYLSQRYSLPTLASDDTVPVLIKEAVTTLAKYRLFERRDAVGQGIQNQRDQVMGWLADVRAGRADLIILDSIGAIESNTKISIESADKVDSDYDNFV